MATRRSIPITVYQNTHKELCFSLSDQPDLRAADIQLRVKLFLTDDTFAICKIPTLEKSPNLICGEFVIDLEPSDTAALEPRTYFYELVITIDGSTSVPTAGDFIVYSSLDC